MNSIIVIVIVIVITFISLSLCTSSPISEHLVENFDSKSPKIGRIWKNLIYKVPADVDVKVDGKRTLYKRKSVAK